VSGREPSAPPELEAMQRLLRALVTAPTGVRPALDGRPGVDGWLDGWPDPRAALAETVLGDRLLPAPARLDVYAQGYFARLHEVLLEDHPTVAWLCGEAIFSDLVTAFLVAHPSQSPTLRDLGRPFGGFLASHPVAAFGRAHWPGIEDVARLEWAFADVFDAPDTPALARADLQRLDPEAWAPIPLEPVPALALLSFDWPVGAVVSARRRDEPLPDRCDAPEHLAVWREDERAVFRTLESQEAAALALVVGGGATFGDLCEWATERTGDDDTAAANALGWLLAWVGSGWLCALPIGFGVG